MGRYSNKLNTTTVAITSSFNIFWFSWFALCLFPYSIEPGYSANYIFVLTPLLYIIFGRGALQSLPRLLVFYFIACCIIFSAKTMLQYEFIDFFDRRLISFLIFISVFSLPLIRFPRKMINSFLAGVVLVSLILSIEAILGTATADTLDPSSLKVLVGTQRIGFLHLFSLWIIAAAVVVRQSALEVCFLLFFSLIVFAGLVLTFSRSSYVGFAVGVIFYLLNMTRAHGLNAKKLLHMVFLLLGLFSFLWAAFALYPEFYDFLDRTMFAFSDAEILDESISNPETSEGGRFFIWGTLINYLISNPLGGTGFLGAWVVSDLTGSSHSDYVDKMLRLGFFGFFIYLLILWKIYAKLCRFSPELTAAFISILAYGFFNETFSLSQGAVCFSFFLVIYSSNSVMHDRVVTSQNYFKLSMNNKCAG